MIIAASRSVDRLTARQQAQRAHQAASQSDQPLHTVTGFRPAQLEFDDVVHRGNRGAGLTTKMLDARRTGSRFLSDEEWGELRAAKPFWPEPDLLEQIEILREPWLGSLPQAEPNIVLVDARHLQTMQYTGTKRHALAVARAVAQSVPAGCELALFTDGLLPPLSGDVLALATMSWRPALLLQVKTFVQLSTMCDPANPCDLDLLRAPWISRIAVFLDNIQGIYPSHFIGTRQAFWRYQLGIEKLRHSTVVLTLGRTSQLEAEALWQSLSGCELRPTITVSSCVSGLAARTLPRRRLTAASRFLVLGNDLPHKNIALPAAALRGLWGSGQTNVRFTYISALAAEQKTALRALVGKSARRSSAATDVLEFSSSPTDESLLELLSSARAVIIPSLHEGFSLPVVEAIEQGTPVLLSRIPAHEELLPEGPWYFDTLDVGSLMDAVDRCIRDGESWAHQQAKALASRYSAETLSEQVHRALALSVKSRPAPERQPTVSDTVATPSATADDSEHEHCADTSALRHELLVDHDASFMRAKLAMQPTAAGQLSAPLPAVHLSTAEHDSVVRLFHRSRTWRAGRIISAPYRAAHYLLGGARP